MPDDAPQTPDASPSFLRRTIAPAVGVMILYASIWALPPLLMNRVPPIDGSDLLRVFLISFVVFFLFGLYNDRRRKQRGPDQ
jgi:hypothetical protein